eukprot:403354899
MNYFSNQNQPARRKSGCKRVFRPLDIYARPIQLTYQGKNAFSTTLGGFLSLMVILLLISISGYKFNDMIKKNLSVVKKNTLVSVSNSYVPPEDLSQKNITFAFMLSNYFVDTFYDDSYYGKFVLKQSVISILKNATDGSSYRRFKSYFIPFSKCEIGKNMFYPNSQEIKQYGIHNYFCPDWQNLTIQGNWYSPEYKVISLFFQRCKGANCATDDELKTWIKNKWVQEIIISSYFDIKDYENPVHYFLDDSYLAIEYGRTTYNTMYFKKDFLQLSDNLIGFFNNVKNDHFYQMSHTKYFTSTDEGGQGAGIYFYQDIKLDKEYDVYERQIYSISSLLQDVGGFYNSLFFIGLFIFASFRESIYFSSLISKLYQIEIKQGSQIDNNQGDSPSHDFESTNGKINIDVKSMNDSIALNAINVLNKLRNFEIIINLLLNKEQKHLLMFQKKHLLQCDNLNSSDDENYENQKSMESTQRILKKIQNKNYYSSPLNQDMHQRKLLEDALCSYSESKTALKDIDKKIIVGLFSNTNLNNNEAKNIKHLDSLSQDSQQAHKINPISNWKKGSAAGAYETGYQRNEEELHTGSTPKRAHGFPQKPSQSTKNARSINKKISGNNKRQLV